MATIPDRKPIRDIPAISFTEWEDPTLIKNALAQLENSGQFQGVGLLMDSMRRDDRIAAVMNTRLNGLLGLDVELEPANDSRKARKAAEAVEQGYPKMAPRAALNQVLNSGLMLGIGLGENVWSYKNGQWVSELKYWHPQFLYWHWTKRMFQLITQDGVIDIPEDGDGGKWMVYCPFGYYLGWRQSLVRALAIPYIIRQLAYRDWARYSEVHGMPIMGAVVPWQQQPDSESRFTGQLANLGNESVVELPQGEGGRNYDLKLIEAQANTWAAFQGLINQTDSAITIAVLGQNLTTEVQAGSFAAAAVHQNGLNDLLRADARALEFSLKKYVIDPYVGFNFGEPDQLSPSPSFKTDPPEDQNTKTQAMQQLATALATFAGMNAPIDVRAILDAAQIPLLSKDAEPKPVAPPPAPPAGKPAPPAPPQPPAAAPPRLNSAVALSGEEQGAEQAQSYLDDVVVDAKKAAAGALEADLSMLVDAVARSGSAKELRAKLADVFGAMDQDRFAEVLEKAHRIAVAAGRAAVFQDL